MLYLIILLLLSFANCTSEFEAFKTKFQRTYVSFEEESYRQSVFRVNMERAAKLNARNTRARFGVTKFSDLTLAEFRAQLTPPSFFSRKFPDTPVHSQTDLLQAAPASKDWCAAGACSPVFNQGQCGSTWAVAAVMAIESALYIKHHHMPLLSVQQILSCDSTDQGCQGGLPQDAFQYIISAGGLETAATYPYTSGTGYSSDCQFDKSKVVASISGWEWATQNNDEPRLVEFVSQTGPPLVCVDADAWQLYTSGVMNEATCGNGTYLNHCAQLVAFDTQQGAYTVENMWGTDWGNAGFIQLTMYENTCGITNQAQWPLVN